MTTVTLDMIMFAYPTKDGACGGIRGRHRRRQTTTSGRTALCWWTHWGSATGIHHDDVSAKPGFGHIRISDYFTTTALGGASACDSTQIMPIGTAAHEFRPCPRAPGSVRTSGSTEGIGEWGLMGSGNFSSPRSPARMEAWSLNEMGWVTLASLTSAGTYSFGAAPVSTPLSTWRVQGAKPRGSTSWSRTASVPSRHGLDTAPLRARGNPPGCRRRSLIFHVDSVQVANNGFHASNAVNVGPIHGVELEEADGLRQLWCEANGCNRGDAGISIQGRPAHTAFTPTSTPAALSTDGQPAGFSLDQITQLVAGGAMSFRLTFPVWSSAPPRIHPPSSSSTGSPIAYSAAFWPRARVIPWPLIARSSPRAAVRSSCLDRGSDGQPRSHTYTGRRVAETSR